MPILAAGVGSIAVIDLGEVPAGQALDDTPARPWPHRRWALCALALGLALLTAGGSAPPPRPLRMAELSARSGSAVSVAGDRLFVAEQDKFDDHRHIAAYRLTDLDQLWRVEVPTGSQAFPMIAVDGTLVVTAGPSGDPAHGPTTVGLDVATGAVRWQHQGALEGPAPGGRLLLSSDLATPGGPPGTAGPGAAGRRLRAVDAYTGDLAWSFDLPSDAAWSYQFDGATFTLLAVVLPTGRVELRDLDTGKVLRSRYIGRLPAVPGGASYAQIIGDLLLVVQEASSTVAYGLDRFDVRWRIPFEAGRDGWPFPCGTAVCLSGSAGGLTLVDPSNGRRRWSDPRWSSVVAEVDGYLITSSGQPDDQALMAVDPDTGQVRRELGSWQQVYPGSGAGSTIGIRYYSTRALVARLDPAHGTRILGVLPDVLLASCWTEASRLLCWRTNNALGIWRLPG